MTTTLSHSHLKKVEGGIIPILGSDLKIGERIPVIRQSPNDVQDLTRLFITKYIDYNKDFTREDLVLTNNFHLNRVNELIYDSNDFIKIRLLTAFISLKGYMNNSIEVLTDYQMLLTQFGILAHLVNKDLVIQRKYENILADLLGENVPNEMVVDDFKIEPDNNSCACPTVEYIVKAINEQIYSGKIPLRDGLSIAKLIVNYRYTDIKHILGSKYILLKNIFKNSDDENITRIIKEIDETPSKDVIWDKIVKLELINESDYMHKFVYDFSVQGNETFALFTGIVVHNTLNSIDWKENILYMQNTECIVEPIGKMIDNLLLKYPDKIEKIEENRTEYLSLEDGYCIPSCDEYGTTNWYQIEAITRHLPVGDLVKVTTESGREVIATQSKSFLVWNDEEQKFLATKGSNIKIGDILPTTEDLPRFEGNTQTHFKYKNIDIELDREFGFIIGLYLTNKFDTFRKEDEEVNKRVINWVDKYNIDDRISLLNYITQDSTEIPTYSYIASDEFIKGLLSGYYRNCEYIDSGSIICKVNNELLLHSISFLLNYFGIIGIYVKKEDLFILEVNKNYTKTLEIDVLEEISPYFPKIGVQTCVNQKQKISHGYKWKYQDIQKVTTIINKKSSVYFDKIVSINFVSGTTEFVYDLTVKETRNFQLFNQLNIRDTFL